jgi:4,5-DOPA dioxygenase extradiol
MLRPLFLSHGAPTLPLEDVAARHFLGGLAATMPRPRAILVVSAHWETPVPTVNAVEQNSTIQHFIACATPRLAIRAWPNG